MIDPLDVLDGISLENMLRRLDESNLDKQEIGWKFSKLFKKLSLKFRSSERKSPKELSKWNPEIWSRCFTICIITASHMLYKFFGLLLQKLRYRIILSLYYHYLKGFCIKGYTKWITRDFYAYSICPKHLFRHDVSATDVPIAVSQLVDEGLRWLLLVAEISIGFFQILQQTLEFDKLCIASAWFQFESESTK